MTPLDHILRALETASLSQDFDAEGWAARWHRTVRALSVVAHRSIGQLTRYRRERLIREHYPHQPEGDEPCHTDTPSPQ